MPCSGRKEGKVDILIDLTLFGPLGAVQEEDKKSPATTKLRLKRSKTCTSSENGTPGPPKGDNTGSGGVRRDDLPHASATPPHMLFLGAVLSAVIVIVLLVICVVIIHMRSRNKLPGSSKSAKTPPPSGPSASATSTTMFMQQQQQQQQQQQHIYEPIPAMSHPQYNSICNRPGTILSQF